MLDQVTLEEWLAQHHCQGFKPLPHYSAIGDQLEWYWTDDGPVFAESIHHDGIWVGTIERLMSDPTRITGVKVFGIKALVEKALAKEHTPGPVIAELPEAPNGTDC